MELYLAIGHIIGAFFVLFLFETGTLILANYQINKNQKFALLEISSSLGVDIDDLDKKELAPKITAFLLKRFGNDQFINRVSDFFGVILTIWKILGGIIQYGLLIYVIWQTITFSFDYAVYAWLVIPIAIFFWVLGYIYSVICWILTGRYPGQAKLVRKALEQQL